MKLIKNKKGFLTDFMVDYWSLIAFTVILLLFFMIFSIQFGGCQDKGREITIVSEGSDIINEKMLLMNLLGSPFDSEINLAEKIAESHLTGDYEEFKDYTIELLKQIDNETYGYEVCSVICIFEGDDNIFELKTKACYKEITEDYCQENRMKIPMGLSDEKKTLTIALSYNTRSAPYIIARNN